MASFTRLFVLLLPLIALLPLAVRSQHTCVYCRSTSQEYPDPTASRFACTRYVNESITCPVTGVMPDCDNTTLIQPAGTNQPDGCNFLNLTANGSLELVTYECNDTILFAGQQWGLRAVITNPACPDPGSIWTECSYSTPLCQPREGIVASQVQGGFQVAVENPSATAMMAPAPEQEMPVAPGGAVQGAAPTVPAPAPEAEVVPPGVVGVVQPIAQPLPGVTTAAPGGGLR